MIEKLDQLEARLSEAERDIDAAHGGDADAAQRARRALLDVDAHDGRGRPRAASGPSSTTRPARIAIAASSTVGMHGTDAERALLQEVLAAMDKARRDKDAPELERQMRLAQRLSAAAFNRTSRGLGVVLRGRRVRGRRVHRPAAGAASSSPRASTAIDRGDTEELRRVVKALWQLLPEDSEARKHGFDSGVR